MDSGSDSAAEHVPLDRSSEEFHDFHQIHGRTDNFLGARSEIRHLNRREPSADDRVLKQKGPLPISKFTQALALFETLIAGGSRRNRDYCAPGSRLADMSSDPRGQIGPRFGEDIHFATGMSRDRLLSCSRQIDAKTQLLLTADCVCSWVPATAQHNIGPPVWTVAHTGHSGALYTVRTGSGCAGGGDRPQFQR